MSKSINIVLSMAVKWQPEYRSFIIAEATNFDAEQNPTSWAIRSGRDAMSKISGEFEYEPMPSSRDDAYFAEFRFSTMQEAIECWESHQK